MIIKADIRNPLLIVLHNWKMCIRDRVTLQQGAASATDDFGQGQQPDGSDSWGNQDDQGELPENPFADGGLYEGNGTF